MRKIITFFALILLCSGMAHAASACTDTDGGKNYGVKGTAKYAITQKEDICVISPSAEIQQDTSQYLKEYYCQDGTMKFEIVDCTREGFERCEYGKCVGGTAEAKLQGTNYTAPPTGPVCGNSIVEAGEECDPMNKICFDDYGNIGLCNAECKCEIKIRQDGTAAKPAAEENKTEVQIEKPVEKDVPAEDISEKYTEKETAPAEKQEKEEKITIEITEKQKEAKSPTGFFSKIWAWIAGLFS